MEHGIPLFVEKSPLASVFEMQGFVVVTGEDRVPLFVKIQGFVVVTGEDRVLLFVEILFDTLRLS